MKHRIDSPEYQLLFSCINHFSDSSHVIAISSEFNEEFFLQLIDRHRIAPLVHKILQNQNLFSNLLLGQLKSHFEQNVFRSMAAKMEMLKFVKFASQNGTKLLFLKGLTLAEKYYSEISHRHTMDLDVWVDPIWIDEAIQYFYDHGYVSHPDWKTIGERQKKYFKQAFHDLTLTHTSEKNRVPIEIHWRIREGNGNFPFDPLKEWGNLQNMSFGSIKCAVMNDVDQFLYLCVHGTEHAWFRLKWFADLPIMLSKVHFDWNFVMFRAIQLKCEKHLFVSLLMLNKLLGFQIPHVIESKINKRDYETNLQYMLDQIVSENHINSNDKERWKTFLFHAKLSRGRNKDFRYVLKYFTTPLDWQLLRLPDSLFFLYFPLRPFLFVYRRLFHTKINHQL